MNIQSMFGAAPSLTVYAIARAAHGAARPRHPRCASACPAARGATCGRRKSSQHGSAPIQFAVRAASRPQNGRGMRLHRRAPDCVMSPGLMVSLRDPRRPTRCCESLGMMPQRSGLQSREQQPEHQRERQALAAQNALRAVTQTRAPTGRRGPRAREAQQGRSVVSQQTQDVR